MAVFLGIDKDQGGKELKWYHCIKQQHLAIRYYFIFNIETPSWYYYI